MIRPAADPRPVDDQPGAETSVVVLAGKLELLVGVDRFVLVEGEAVFLPASVKHAIRNAGDGDCVSLVIRGAADADVNEANGFTELAPIDRDRP